MPEQTNTIKRLHNILSAVIDHGSANVTPASSASIAWTGAFGMSSQECLDNLLCGLIADISDYERLVKRDTRINEAVHLKHLTRVKSGLLSVNSGVWESFRKTFDDGLLDVLQLMSENISAHRVEEIIPDQDLASLQADLTDLIDKVLSSDFDSEIKSVLIDGLESVRQAIIDYRIFGAERIRQALDRNVGLIHRYREEFKTAYESNDRQVVADFLGFLKKADIVVSTASKIKQLAAPIIDRMLESGG